VIDVACYQCGSNEVRAYAEENGFRLVKCAGCGLLYVSPRPSDTEISEGMRTGQHRGLVTLDRVGQFEPRKVDTYLGVLGRLLTPEALAGFRWLDVGCGHGEFLEALRGFCREPLTLTGLEPGEAKRRQASARGLSIVDEAFKPEPGSLDGLSVLNVYSHLPDPVQALSEWRRWLRPGGLFVIQTGDSCHLPYRYHHKPFDLPDHLSFTNEPLLRALLERIGFKVRRCTKLRHGGYRSWEFWKHPRRDMWMLAERVG
jgi:SAM-dependent methyltransferase